MDWTQMRITVPATDAARAADIANMVVPYGLYIEDYSDLEEGARTIAHSDLIDRELLEKDRTQAILHVYISPEENPAEAVSFLRERYEAAGISYRVDCDTVREEDWANGWKAYFKPMPVGRRLLIRPTWEPAGETDGRAVLSIDPGMAFGTGGHATTRLVLEALEDSIRPEATMLDVGCGSGILSIAALLLGARQAVGVDIDALAVKTAIENGQINHMSPPRYRILQGNLVEAVEGRFDVVAANIVADAIISLAPAIPPFLSPGGTFIASGIIDTREDDVMAALDAAGLSVSQRREESGWLCLVCRARG